jgi:hypothetical protein
VKEDLPTGSLHQTEAEAGLAFRMRALEANRSPHDVADVIASLARIVRAGSQERLSWWMADRDFERAKGTVLPRKKIQ